MGPDPRCEDYPCHFEGQDCTWCVCPFYPCGDFRTNGKQIESDKDGKLVWDCSNCTWIHSPKVAKAVLDEIIKFTNSGKHELGKISKGKLLQLRLRLIEILNGPQA
ncbi:hypothetical protein AKJ43_00340 [candidate division MSBL1 archaeon SCGC-AAA261D19]|uniref:Cysteine-rich small domain-containing protein n=1 Tax=candidate division MSBL1 archaeon SCGC-AAA261D19 TaxID=1698273 RepID=A0A133V8U1_9EURY|nr:hypothetical protein AKJ43_00340 [candidate division MSBL1 archaeon SCGC-AAA261D19]